MSQCLIDDNGRVWPAGSEELRSLLGFAARPVDDRAKFAVANLGFVFVQRLQHGALVQWRPTFVKRPTFVALLLLLKCEPESRVLISTLRKTWSDAIFGSLSAGRDALLHEFETARSDVGGYFRTSARSAESLDQTACLSLTLQRAQSSAFAFDPVELWQMLSEVTDSRYALLDPSPDPERTRIVALGNGYAGITRDWMTKASGRYFLDQPDAAYARAASAAYWPTTQRRTPLIEDVDASVWWAAHGRCRRQYTRVLFSVEVAGRGRLLLSVSQRNGAL
jgi:hypothetical protein